jgi:hypothetical protein
LCESYLPRLAVTLGLPTLGAETPVKDRVRLDCSLSVATVASCRLSPDIKANFASGSVIASPYQLYPDCKNSTVLRRHPAALTFKDWVSVRYPATDYQHYLGARLFRDGSPMGLAGGSVGDVRATPLWM